MNTQQKLFRKYYLFKKLKDQPFFNKKTHISEISQEQFNNLPLNIQKWVTELSTMGFPIQLQLL